MEIGLIFKKALKIMFFMLYLQISGYSPSVGPLIRGNIARVNTTASISLVPAAHNPANDLNL